MYQYDRHPDAPSIAELAELLSTGLDPEFDFIGEETERQFQELRLQQHPFA